MAGLVLFHGAGSDREHSALVAVDAAVRAAHPEVAVERVDFPYRQRPGRRPPDREPVLLQAVRDAAGAIGPEPSVLGGRSMGGRMASLAVGAAQDPLPAAGLVLISYPLHPPGKPERLRVEHFPRLELPCLFVSGTRDPFGTPDELEAWTATIPGPVEHVWIDGGAHDLKGADDRVAAAVVAWTRATGVFGSPRGAPTRRVPPRD